MFDGNLTSTRKDGKSVVESIGIVGATGAVGTIIRHLLWERRFPAKRVRLLASARSAGKKLSYGDQELTVEAVSPAAFDDIDLCIASTPDDTAREFIPEAVKRGTVVVDESGAWRMDPEVPLVVPEVNAHAIANHRGIISSPNCSTTQMVVAMKPLHDAATIRRVIVSTYQATSGSGVAGQQDLEEGMRAFAADDTHQPAAFQHPIVGNVIPQIGSPKHAGYTSEEMKMVWETQKIFETEAIQVCPTCVRVPVVNCHSESILVETEQKLTAGEARELFKAADGIVVVDDLVNHAYPMPVSCDGQDPVFVGRIREDLSHPHGIAFWCVSDNLRKGAATNAVQIAEYLVKTQKLGAMPTFKLTVAYDGTDYAGWQIQHNGNTIQAELERAVRKLAADSTRVVGSGRTDAGVHAKAQVASVTIGRDFSPRELQRALNGNLPSDIRVEDVQRVSDRFHALRDAVAKRYRYVIQTGPVQDVFNRRFSWFIRGQLDGDAMVEAAAMLVGEHDFSCFEASGSPRANSVRRIHDLVVLRPDHASHLLWIEIEANGFLYNMVRNIVGTLVEVGQQKRDPASLATLLQSRDRARAGPTAPAHGLCLLNVCYRMPAEISEVA